LQTNFDSLSSSRIFTEGALFVYFIINSLLNSLSQLPDTVQDFLQSFDHGALDPLLAHLRREVFHEAWRLLLDDEFVHAYEHGIVLHCADGIRRRVYPRIFTYSADYPEK
jgi:hypothetical protein